MNYEKYSMSGKELLSYFIKFTLIVFMCAYLFYNSLFACLLLLIAFPFSLRLEKKRLLKIRKKELRNQFREMISSVATSLSAGMSAENAFAEAIAEMKKLFGDGSYIVKELISIENALSYGDTLNHCLENFAERALEDDISDFVGVFNIARDSGGDFVGIIGRSTEIIRNRQETEYEIEVVISGKKYEHRIMSLIPFGIIGYLRMAQEGFIDILYGNAFGISVMTLCLALYAFAFWLGERIISIEV